MDLSPTHDGKTLLTQLENDLEAAAARTAEREAALAARHHDQRQRWDAWHAQWLRQLESTNRRQKNRLDERLQATNLAAAAEAQLEQMTGSLRQWLQSADALVQ